jgi:anhydro-N-acetylmuramic acid kinase
MMNQLNINLQKLLLSAQKQDKLGIGLMSGTSLDGLDVALCRFSGNGLNTKFKLLQFKTLPYAEAFKAEVRQVFSRKMVDLEKLCLLNAYIGNYHAELVSECLKIWNIAAADVDYIASHGQTIYHAPKSLHGQANYPNATLQIGDADHIAVKTGILTISDFRQKHIAAGGQGAPLALYGDVILGSKTGENRILLNIGGIANFTFLSADADALKVMCTDTGPGNTLIDAACKKYFDKDYDEDSQIAFSGNVNESLLTVLLNHPFFKEALPKTTGPELFNLSYLEAAQQKSTTNNLLPADVIATLSTFSAYHIANAIKLCAHIENLKIFISGGGAHNPFIIQCLQKLLPGAVIANTNKLNIQPDAKEAILFALLGNEALCGEPIKIGNNPEVLMGKFSFPL